MKRQEYLESRHKATQEIHNKIYEEYGKGQLSASKIAKMYPNPSTGKPYCTTYIYTIYSIIKNSKQTT